MCPRPPGLLKERLQRGRPPMQAPLVRLGGLFLVEKTLCIIPIIIVRKIICLFGEQLYLFDEKMQKCRK